MRPRERPQPSPRQSQGIFSKNKASWTPAARRGGTAAVDAGADVAGWTGSARGAGRGGRARGRRSACAAGPRL